MSRRKRISYVFPNGWHRDFQRRLTELERSGRLDPDLPVRRRKYPSKGKVKR